MRRQRSERSTFGVGIVFQRIRLRRSCSSNPIFGDSRTPYRCCPALLPEVWLYWDPKTALERGKDALLRFSMDFLMLLPNGVRIVIEVDGKHHYSDASGRGDPQKYADMVAADRDLRLAGYDVYRFGAVELNGESGVRNAGDFFERLFKLYKLPVHKKLPS